MSLILNDMEYSAVKLNCPIIPIGDHCTAAIILKDLRLRHLSYPFDWISHLDELNGNLLNVIINILESVSSGEEISNLLENFLPIPYFEPDRIKFAVRNSIKFPHDKFHLSQSDYDSDCAKYKRRFVRLASRLFSSQPSHYLYISKRYVVASEHLSMLSDILLWNKKSTLTIVSGHGKELRHICFSPFLLFYNVPYRSNLPDWIEYTGSDYHLHDLLYWRPQLLELLGKLYC